MTDPNPFISGIILAAGRSERMGQIKQLLPFRGRPLLAHSVETALGSSLNEVVVVLGHGAAQIKEAVAFGHARVLINEGHKAGQSSSMIAGLSCVSDRTTAALFLLGDQPLLSREVVNRIIQEYKQTNAWIIIPTYHGKRGNPVLVSHNLFARLMSIHGDLGAREVFKEFAEKIKEVEVDDACILRDIDTLEDYKNLLSETDSSAI